MNPPAARLFFALQPDPRVIRRVHRVQQALDPGAGARAVAPDNFHVTLVFLGDQDLSRLPDLRQAAASVHCPAVSVTLDRVGMFDRPGVGWLGCSNLPIPLVDFQHRLSVALEEWEFVVDHRQWEFHLTLYRRLRTALPRLSPGPVQWGLDGFVLMQSERGNSGVYYRVLDRWQAE